MKCVQCGAGVDPQDNFCRNCGAPLARAGDATGAPETPSACPARDAKRALRLKRRLRAAAAALVILALAAVVCAELAPDLIYLSLGGKLRDLGVTYTDADYQSILAKTGVKADEPPAQADRGDVRDEYAGQMDIDWTFTESELTAWMNMDGRPGYWPFDSVQIRLHPGNVVEASLYIDAKKLMTFDSVTKCLPREITSFLSGTPDKIPVYAKAKVAFTGADQVDIQMQAFEAANLPVSALGVSEEANQILETLLHEAFAQAEGVSVGGFTTGEGTLHMTGTWYKEIKRVPVKKGPAAK